MWVKYVARIRYEMRRRSKTVVEKPKGRIIPRMT